MKTILILTLFAVVLSANLRDEPMVLEPTRTTLKDLLKKISEISNFISGNHVEVPNGSTENENYEEF